MRLKTAGLPIADFRMYTVSTDPNHLLGRPGQYISKVNFHDRRLTRSTSFAVSGGGSVETFERTRDAERRFEYLRAVTDTSPLFGEYHYLEGRVILRLSFDLTPLQAKSYEDTFQRLL